jgi:hypothetical protein
MEKKIRMYTADLKGGRLKKTDDWPQAVPEERRKAVNKLIKSHPEQTIFIYCCFFGEHLSNVFIASSPKTIRQLRDRWVESDTINFLKELQKIVVEFNLPPIAFLQPRSDGTSMMVIIDASKVKKK